MIANVGQVETEGSMHKRAESVLAIIPCLNEEAHLESVVSGLLSESDAIDLQIVVADGGSSDSTVAIAKRLAAAYPNVSYFHNSRRIQSAAINSAVELFGRGHRNFIRVDAHCRYPKDYCQRLLAAQRRTGSASVVVSMVAEGRSCFQKAAAAAQNSWLGNGGSAHRIRGEGRHVDHGHHALMSIPAFKSVGGYDESFTHNEDAELDTRLRQTAYEIWLMADSPITYLPRKSPWSLLQQYISYGKGRARNVLKHRLRPRLRQSLPLLVAPAVMMLPLAAINLLFCVPFLLWAASCLAYGAALGVRSRSICAGMSGFAAIIMHFGWSLGFLIGIWRSAAQRDGKSRPSAELCQLPRSVEHDRGP
jgi:succinoglycan biosynthesis protein ExoA